MSHAINVTFHAACTCVCRRPEAVQYERSKHCHQSYISPFVSTGLQMHHLCHVCEAVLPCALPL